MKTFKTIAITFVVTMVLVLVGVVGFLFNEGIVTIEKRDISHNKTVIVDGVVTETHDWNEVLGYDVKIAVVDGAYIGR